MNLLSKQNREMRHGMRKMHSLKVRCYAAHFIDLNEYLDSLPNSTLSEEFGVTELNENFLNSIPNNWIKQAYAQGFHCNYITFKISVNMFERIRIVEYIYQVIVEPSNEQYTRTDATRDFHSSKK